MKYTIELSEAEAKALAYVAVDPQEWVRNAAASRASVAMDEIFQSEVQRMLADPDVTDIPADKEAVVLAASILTAAQRHAALEQEMLTPKELPNV